ncbi:tetratricopeptide repeat protein [Propioniciclava sp. MC1683]|uniref:tetratricopeptide repeat protein n=1 Tax=Propioniciclava sp. MC1683 TaxID=2760309 RepID=UPI0035CCE824
MPTTRPHTRVLSPHRSGREPEAVQYEQLLADQQRVLGSEHPNTLATRYNLAGLMRDMGDLGGARALYEQLLADQQRVLGSEHPNTALTRSALGRVS